MRKINIYLHLLMFIGVGVTLLHFFSTPVHADSGTGNWHYSEVVDSWDEVGYRQYGSGDSQYYIINYAGYSHGEITITTDNENAYGSVSIYGKTYFYSGYVTYHKTASNKTSWQVRTDRYEPGTGTPSSVPPFNLTDTRGSFTTNIVDTRNFIDIPTTYGGLTSDFENYDTNPNQNILGRYFSLGNFDFTDKTDAVFKLMIPVTGVTIDGSKIKLWTFNRLNELVEIPLTHYIYQESRYYSILFFSLSDEFKFNRVPINNMPLYITFGINTAFYYNVANYPITFQYIPFDTDGYYYMYDWINSNAYYNQTIEKPSESTDVDNSNSSFSSSSQQMMDLEDQLQGDFNSAIGNITVPDNPFGNMGQMFGNSSRFLVHMFDQMTIYNGSPFGTVITFSLILGLALLMIGKKGSK